MDIEIKKFQQDIVSYINNSSLPIMVKKLVLKDIYIQIDLVAENAIKEEIIRLQSENKEEKKIIRSVIYVWGNMFG